MKVLYHFDLFLSKPYKPVAHVNTIIPAGTTVRFVKSGNNKDYALLPLGDTIYSGLTIPASSGPYSVTYAVEYEITTDNADTLTDSSTPPKTFGRYVGGRPTGR